MGEEFERAVEWFVGGRTASDEFREEATDYLRMVCAFPRLRELLEEAGRIGTADPWEKFTASDGEPALRGRSDLYEFVEPSSEQEGK